MKNLLFLVLLLASLFTACSDPSSKPNSLLSTTDVKRVVLVGGSLISGMEDHAFFEKSMIMYYPAGQTSFRNIGWPADDVFGLARSQFGSAQNTMSWQPPTAEEGFGSKKLNEHINEASPTSLIIGYGSEVAFAKEEKELDIFKSGYKRLLDFAEEKQIKLVLLSPPRHEKYTDALTTHLKDSNAVAALLPADLAPVEKRNEWLGMARDFIKEQADSRGHIFIDVYENLVEDPNNQKYTENGVLLNKEGYKKLNEVLLNGLNIDLVNGFTISLDKQAAIVNTENAQTSNWNETLRGASFKLTPNKMLYSGKIVSKEPVAIYINGELSSKNQDTLSMVNLFLDSLEEARLVNTIKEKNQLYRYRLRPLNEAYIYLFRRHEMGHLAYELDDLLKLVEEKEREISGLLNSYTYDVEIELIKPWKSPKDYAEDEVPAHIQEPNIEEELAAFQVPEGFEMSLFAADPMIANPISINWDTKGRAWVATSSTYPQIVPGREPNDKIIILEDTNNDGVADKHTVFAENLLIPHSVMPVDGGAYVTATTQLLFLADTDGDDVADKTYVVYDGFGNADVHHTIHGLRWSPWGDLHFTQSIYINTFVETAYGTRILNGSGTWAFRPETERLEVYSRGLVNPWGEGFDQWGQTFATDGAGSSGLNYTFPGSAHATAVGATRVLDGLNRNKPKNTASEVIYSRHFPASWQGTVIANDYRANRTVRYKLTPQGSGYEAQEVQTVLHSEHRSYRPVDTKIGPDGALYIVDWYNPIINHGEVDFHHPLRDRTHGRVWKLTRKDVPLQKVPNLQKATETELLELLKSHEKFTRTQVNRAYVERNGNPQTVVDWVKNLRSTDPEYSRHRLEGLWLLTALNYYDQSILMEVLQSRNPLERAAGVRMLGHWKKQTEYKDLLEKLVSDPHPQVRLETLHALRMLGEDQLSMGVGEISGMELRPAELAMKVLDQPMDKNLSFALDLTLEKLLEAWLPAIARGDNLFSGSVNHQMYALLTNEDPRVVDPVNKLLNEPELDAELSERAWRLLAKIGDTPTRTKVFEKAVNGENNSLLMAMINAPKSFGAVPENTALLEKLFTHKDAALRIAGLRLAARWETVQYADELSENIEKATSRNEKLQGYRTLLTLGKTQVVEDAAQSSGDPETRTAASVVWIESDVEAAADNAVALLTELEDPELATMIFTAFRSLEAGPKALLKALEGVTMEEKIASAGLTVIQTSSLNLTGLEDALKRVGNIQSVGVEMTQEEKDQLIKDVLASGNPYRGRQIYRRPALLCQTCHQTEGEGGFTGPDLSNVGSFMEPNSILEALLNPSKEIKQNYETVLLTKKNGELISGLLHRKTSNSTLIRLPNSDIVEIPAEEIQKVDVSPMSLMPPGLTGSLHRDELRDLLAYLSGLGVGN